MEEGSEGSDDEELEDQQEDEQLDDMLDQVKALTKNRMR